MSRPTIPIDEKRKKRNVSLSNSEVLELKELSVRGEVSDGVRVALMEARTMREYRKSLRKAELDGLN